MCGFIQRDACSPGVFNILRKVGLDNLIPAFEKEDAGKLNFYPAFGKNPNRQIENLIVSPNKTVDATWWFDCKPDGDTLEVGDRTTFNARNLDSPFWKGAVRHNRAIVVGTALGESNKVGSTNEHYLMNAKGAILFGAVYREFENGCYSTAVITRPPHERFSKYHQKSIPCFLPHDKDFVSAWLDGDAKDALVMSELDNPKIHQDLAVTKVKTFKGGESLSDDELLVADQEPM